MATNAEIVALAAKITEMTEQAKKFRRFGDEQVRIAKKHQQFAVERYQRASSIDDDICQACTELRIKVHTAPSHLSVMGTDPNDAGDAVPYLSGGSVDFSIVEPMARAEQISEIITGQVSTDNTITAPSTLQMLNASLSVEPRMFSRLRANELIGHGLTAKETFRDH